MNATVNITNDVQRPSLYNAVLNTVFSQEDTGEPIEVDDVKTWGRIDVADDDDLIRELITAARQRCEEYSNLSFLGRTVEATITAPNGYMKLPYGPAVEIESVKDIDGNNITDYKFNGQGFKVCGVAVVTYSAGFVVDGSTVLPTSLKTALKNQVLFMYENRGDATTISPVALTALKSVRVV